MTKNEALDLAKKYVKLDEVESCVVTSNGDVYIDKKASELTSLYEGREIEFITVKGEDSVSETEVAKPERKKRNGTSESND